MSRANTQMTRNTHAVGVEVVVRIHAVDAVLLYQLFRPSPSSPAGAGFFFYEKINYIYTFMHIHDNV